jgi:hypothetical protein
MQKFIRLTSDEFNNTLMTEEVYKDIQLQMSSGDYGSHTWYEVSLDMIHPTELIIWYLDADETLVHTANYYQKKYNIKPAVWLKPKAKAKAKARRSKQLAPVISINRAKPKDRTPRERLLKNQRELFGYIAPVISLDKRRA